MRWFLIVGMFVCGAIADAQPMNKGQAVAMFVAGTLAGVGGGHFIGSADAAATIRFQNAQVWVTRWSTDGGPLYGGRTCSYEIAADGGMRDTCSDLHEMDQSACTAFENWLTSVGVAPPRK